MSRYLLTIAAVAGLAGMGFYTANVFAEDKAKAEDKPKDEVKKEEPREVVKSTPGSKAFQELSAAYTLAKLGKEKKSPELLLAAARVIGTTNFGKLDLKGSEIGKNSKLEEVDLLKEATDLIAAAKEAAGTNADAVAKLAAAIESDIKEFKRGAVGGPRGWNGKLLKGYDTTDTYKVTFKGGEPASVEVKNFTNKGDIDLIIYGPGLPANGLRDARADDDAFLSWYPSKNAQYTIVVKAYAGNFPMNYRIQTN